MIHNIANKLAIFLLKRSPGNQYSIEVIQFSLILILNIIFTVIYSLTIAFFLNHFYDTLVLLISSYFLRQYSGGFHMAKSWQCIISTILLSNIIPYIYLPHFITLILTIISIILVYMFAPSRIESDTIIPKEKYPLLRSKSALIISLNFIILSPILSVTFLLQSLSLITFNRKG